MKVKFLPQNIEVEVVPGKSLLQIATDNHLEIKSVCKGVPSCAECRVKIISGENNVFPPNKAELNLIGTSCYIDSRRLSCQVKCFGDLTVDLTEQVERSDTQSKKVRGYRSPKHQESHAIQDTMILKEQPITETVTPSGVNPSSNRSKDIVSRERNSESSHPSVSMKQSRAQGGSGNKGTQKKSSGNSSKSNNNLSSSRSQSRHRR